jgi:hypothetical protein
MLCRLPRCNVNGAIGGFSRRCANTLNLDVARLGETTVHRDLHGALLGYERVRGRQGRYRTARARGDM